MTRTKMMTALAGLASGAAVFALGSGVGSQAAEGEPQALCYSAKDCSAKFIDDWAGAYMDPSSSGPKMYSIE